MKARPQDALSVRATTGEPEDEESGFAKTDALESEIAEHVGRWLLEHGFTGTDRLGRKWVDGKEVKSQETGDRRQKRHRRCPRKTGPRPRRRSMRPLPVLPVLRSRRKGSSLRARTLRCLSRAMRISSRGR